MNRKSAKSIPHMKGKPKKKGKPHFSFFESKILAVLRRSPDKAISARELLRKTGLKEKEPFYEAVKKLSENGYIIADKKHMIALNRDAGAVRATLVSLSAGFGFARPEAGGDDIFIHGSALGGALVGATVLVSGIRKDQKGLSGSILRVLTQAKDTTTGTLRLTEFGAELIPDNAIRFCPAVRDTAGAKEGDKVLARLHQDFRGDWNEAEILKVFGSGDSARICSDAIIEQYGIPSVFSPELLHEAQRIGSLEIDPQELAARLDLRDQPIFTIDGADAKDLDDAISAEKTAGGYRLGVHIADVSHYIQAKSPLDEEAMDRGTSVYFADRVIPMLPEAISNGVCSLNADSDKLCFSALMELDENGLLQDYRFVKTVIRSKVRGVYGEVNQIFDGSADKDLLKKYKPVAKGLETARQLALLLRKNAAARGTMELESGESRFVLDEQGVCIDVQPRQSGEAQEMIEQLMITANCAAAKMSMEAEIPFLYRIHESPDPTRVQELGELLHALGIPCRELQSGKPATGDFAAILDRARGTATETLVSQRLLRTMEKAKYSTEPLGHFGLALKDYSHFTSPIRRYPDTSIHRILSFWVAGTPKRELTARFKSFAERSAAQSSAAEVRAVQAERDAEDCYMAEFMRAHIGEGFHGVVSGATRNGIFVRLPNSVEGFVPTDSFTGNHFVFDGMITHRCSRTGRVLTIGTELDIRVASAHVATGKVDFIPDEKQPL